MKKLSEIVPLLSEEELDRFMKMDFKYDHGPYQGYHERYYKATMDTEKWRVEKWTDTSSLDKDLVGGLWFDATPIETVLEQEIKYLALHDKDDSRSLFEELKERCPKAYKIYALRKNHGKIS